MKYSIKMFYAVSIFLVTGIYHLNVFHKPLPDNERVIKDLISKYADARDERDPEAIVMLFTEDADQLVSSGEWRFGQDKLVAGMLRSSQRNPGDRTITVERVRFIKSNVAVADARYQIKGRDGAADRNMWSTFIAVKESGHWRLTAIRNMLPAS